MQVERVDEVLAYLCERLGWPRTEPVHHAAVEESGGGRAAALEALGGWVHREHDVQATLDLRRWNRMFTRE